MKVAIWFDPACPWCWRTSRWLLAVAPSRDLDISWRSISLLEKNGGADKVPQDFRASVQATHRMLRVIERLRALDGGGDEAVERFYTEAGAQIHHDGVPAPDVDLAAVLVALGHDPALASAADDEAIDDVIRESMAEALRLAGSDVGTPIGRIGDGALFGPVLEPVPSGDEALRVFDAVAVLASASGFWELKRSRSGPPTTLPPRPATALAPSSRR
ncbi:MAG: DsbA family protein [Candidatus Dormibacteraeota bacterium]|uniref:DsbA family protein n=1 Tax=Candidatus Amunia macphersoniae TaxID=3127014 RepID=A0A934KIF0_9BACT|nr:DsbA family protein [Candidatus Dormibacteraeota bacterium]